MYERHFKRVMDIVLSIAAILVLTPVFMIVAILVLLDLGCPVIHKAARVGKDERVFTLYKFRSMTEERDTDGNLLPDNLRLTRLGRLLRSTSVDELPGLVNVLKGDMSLVGPRPLPSVYLPYYRDAECRRHSIRPGLSGLAQVSGRNDLSWDDKLSCDIEYVDNVALVGDIIIMFKTVRRVLERSGIGLAGTGGLESFHDQRIRQTEEPSEARPKLPVE